MLLKFYPSKCYLATLHVCSTQQQQYSVLRMLLYHTASTLRMLASIFVGLWFGRDAGSKVEIILEQR